MASYGATLRGLEMLLECRLRLINRGCNDIVVDNAINLMITNLLQESSFPANAEDYCRRLKIIRQQFTGLLISYINLLILRQEALLPKPKPNISKRRSPKMPLSAVPPSRVRRVPEKNTDLNVAALFRGEVIPARVYRI